MTGWGPADQGEGEGEGEGEDEGEDEDAQIVIGLCCEGGRVIMYAPYVQKEERFEF